MANGGRASKGFGMGNPHIAMLLEPDWKRAKWAIEATNQTRPARIRAPDSHAANPIPVCSPVNNYGARTAVDERRLWMDSGCGCADSANHIT
jgi:hypothetical protein